MSVESVEKLMGETADAIAYQKVGGAVILGSTHYRADEERSVVVVCGSFQEVDEMLQSRMSVEDEEAVQAELEAMLAEQVRIECRGCAGDTADSTGCPFVQNAGKQPKLPNVPTKDPTPIETSEPGMSRL